MSSAELIGEIKESRLVGSEDKSERWWCQSLGIWWIIRHSLSTIIEQEVEMVNLSSNIYWVLIFCTVLCRILWITQRNKDLLKCALSKAIFKIYLFIFKSNFKRLIICHVYKFMKLYGVSLVYFWGESSSYCNSHLIGTRKVSDLCLDIWQLRTKDIFSLFCSLMRLCL